MSLNALIHFNSLCFNVQKHLNTSYNNKITHQSLSLQASHVAPLPLSLSLSSPRSSAVKEPERHANNLINRRNVCAWLCEGVIY